MSFGTVSILTTPDQFSPVNTDGLWFQMNSASYSSPNFKYLVDVYCTPNFVQPMTNQRCMVLTYQLEPTSLNYKLKMRNSGD